MDSLYMIPTIRNPSIIDYYANLKDSEKKRIFFLIITEDLPEKGEYKKHIRDLGLDGEVFGRVERDVFMNENGLSKYSYLIPENSHAETSFGLVYQQMNREFKYGFFIDDDTVPLGGGNSFYQKHIDNLNFSGKIESVGSSNNWVNVLYQSYGKYGFYPRGYPFSKRNNDSTLATTEYIHEGGKVYISQGLWTNMPDLNAVDILVHGGLEGLIEKHMTIEDYKSNFVVKKSNFQTVCSMNLAFKREVIPFFYQFLMDSNPYGVGRFDDIWSGIIAKKVLDNEGYYILNGYPLCIHNKEKRNIFKDLKAESVGYEMNEVFCNIVESTDIQGLRPKEAVLKIADRMAESRFPFIKDSGKHLLDWIGLVEAALR